MLKKYILKKTSQAGNIQSRFSINYEQELNSSQFEAVSSINGMYLVIAGAGTGKTKTLVYRVARLVELGYNPKSILLLTFTRKAAREMMNKASLLLDKRCSKVNGGTFHSFANLTLRKYSKFINLNPNFTILDQGDSEDVINLIRGQLNLNQKEKRFPNKKTVFNVISLSINKGVPVQRIVSEEYPHFEDYIDKLLEIKKIYALYKAKNSLLDYDDLLIYLRKFLFEMNEGTKLLLSKINFVMVDEYQDTNKLQADLVKGLSQLNHNLMVVGDDAQSIYSFRGANFKNIMDFPKIFPDTKIIKLEENYRSTQNILNFANHIIDGAIEKYTKFLYSKRKDGELPVIISASTENMQSRFIVERILELNESGVPLNEIAVLFRSSFFSFDLEIELNKANIPFIKFGGLKFIETAHVKDVLAFLRIIANPKDFVSWYRVLLLHEGIGPKKAQAIINEIEQSELSITQNFNSIIKKKYKNNIYALFSLLSNVHQNFPLPADKIEVILNYYEPLFRAKYDDFNKRKKDLEIFNNIASNYKSLTSFLSDMVLEPPRDSVIDVDSEDKEKEFLTLSTIHSAKGLEWHTVFIIHALEGFFPSGQSFDKIETLEEERRLMYVASTRAKENLYVSYPMHIFDRYNGFTMAKPSRFINDISEDLADEWLLEES